MLFLLTNVGKVWVFLGISLRKVVGMEWQAEVTGKLINKGEERVRNFIIMDDLELEDYEKKYLSIPPKFKERTEDWMEEFEIELEINAVKERWESRMIDRRVEEGVEDREEYRKED